MVSRPPPYERKLITVLCLGAPFQQNNNNNNIITKTLTWGGEDPSCCNIPEKIANSSFKQKMQKSKQKAYT